MLFTRLIKQHSILTTLYKESISYLSPTNLNGWWNFGSLALLCLVVQVATGIFLTMHYIPHESMAFWSVEHIMRDVNSGWLIRYVHANGASFFFMVVYFHLFRGLYFGSYTYPRQEVWNIGVVILLIMILTAFLGYVLPWGQMSFWAATVITSLVSTVPVVGVDIVYWLWGGFSVSTVTLNRFLSLHYLLPFVLIFLVLLHLVFLHEAGSGNPLGIDNKFFGNQYIDAQRLHPFYTIKDLHGVLLYSAFFLFFVCFAPNFFGHPDNYIPANPDQTPAHIVPEWYFLPFYAILRSVPNKLLGVVLLLLAIIVLLVFPTLVNKTINVRSNTFKPLSQFAFWLFVVNCLVLGWVGGKSIEYPYTEIGFLSTVFYFGYFIVILPFLHVWETYGLGFYLPKSPKNSLFARRYVRSSGSFLTALGLKRSQAYAVHMSFFRLYYWYIRFWPSTFGRVFMILLVEAIGFCLTGYAIKRRMHRSQTFEFCMYSIIKKHTLLLPKWLAKLIWKIYFFFPIP